MSNEQVYGDVASVQSVGPGVVPVGEYWNLPRGDAGAAALSAAVPVKITVPARCVPTAASVT